MSFPVGDWQFWVATMVVLGSVWQLVRPFLATRAEGEGCPGCQGCPPQEGASDTGLVTLGQSTAEGLGQAPKRGLGS